LELRGSAKSPARPIAGRGAMRAWALRRRSRGDQSHGCGEECCSAGITVVPRQLIGIGPEGARNVQKGVVLLGEIDIQVFDLCREVQDDLGLRSFSHGVTEMGLTVELRERRSAASRTSKRQGGIQSTIGEASGDMNKVVSTAIQSSCWRVAPDASSPSCFSAGHMLPASSSDAIPRRSRMPMH
jgi:hypothetical protein